MTNYSAIPLDAQEIVDFLRRNLQLEAIYRHIISQRIINQAALERGITIAPEEIQIRLDEILYENNLEHPSQLLGWLAAKMATLADLRLRIREQLLAEKLAKDLFLQVAEELVARNPDQLDEILLYKISLPYESLAREIFYQIEEEEISFYEAAHLYDIDQRRRLQCGFEGKRRRRAFPPDVAELLFNASIGDVLGPLKTSEQRYELFLVDELINPTSTQEIASSLVDEMFQAWMDRQIADYVARALPEIESEDS